MKKKTIVILSALIACCLAVVLVVSSKAGDGSGTLYSGGNNLVVGTMLPNELTPIEWEGSKSVMYDDTTMLAMSSQQLTGKVNGSDETVKVMLSDYIVQCGSSISDERFYIYIYSGKEYCPVDGDVHFIINNQDTVYSPSIHIAYGYPTDYYIEKFPKYIADLFLDSASTQEIKMRFVDNNDSNKYVEFAFTKGNFDEVYYTEEIQ